ncbi:right-handed parallel beta-helix repeat-containing protein [Pontiella desulfatans]|nr:right-handed parallel beta-helix repeat-containing protein [Pontiella desulfatans]
MKHWISIQLISLLFSASPLIASGTAYYLSSSSGNDSGEGTPSSPWKSLSRINSTKLKPGDEIYFKKNDRFDGRFVLNGSGTKDQPIRITSYGEGPLPVITGHSDGGDFQEAVYVLNNDNIVFDRLEIQNERTRSRSGVKDDDAYGLHVHNTGGRVMKNIIVRNMVFKNVYAVKPMLNPDDFDGIEVAGIRFSSSRNRRGHPPKNIRNILVEDCLFSDIQRLGIHIKHSGSQDGARDPINHNENVIVRNNEFHHLGGTSVLPIRTYNCLIENNLFNHPGSSKDSRMPGRGSSVWTWRCVNTVIQRNTCLSTRGYLDSHGIHIDHENINTFVQYNYMEDCEGGFVEILGGNSNAVYRFNISVNDGWRDNPNWGSSNHTLWINNVGPGKKEHHCTHSYIYNNTVFMDRDFSTAIEMNAKNTFIYNNLFVNEGGGEIGGKRVMVKNNDTPLFLKNNLYSGGINSEFTDMDSDPVMAEPMFSGSGEGAERFRLAVNSPAKHAGVPVAGPPIPGAGKGVFKHLPPYPTEDYFGNPIDLSRGTPTLGAGK